MLLDWHLEPPKYLPSPGKEKLCLFNHLLNAKRFDPHAMDKSHPKNEQKRCLEKPEHHSSQLTTCSLWVMMDKDFSCWDEIKIYMHCFLSQLVGRSSSFNSISAASDGHPESWLSNGAVSWQKPKRAVGTSGRSRHSRGWTMTPGKHPNCLQTLAGLIYNRPYQYLSLSLFFMRIRFSLLHSIALLCHFLQLLSFPWNMALRQLIRVLHCVISSNFY